MGYHIPHTTSSCRTGDAWKHGYEIEHAKSGIRYWLCRICHQRKAHKTHLYVGIGTQNHAKHLFREHRIGEDPQQAVKRRRTVFERLRLQADLPEDQKRINTLVRSFDPNRFCRLLLQWIIHDNIAFRKIESDYFHQLLAYTNQAVITGGCLPNHSTVRSLIVAEFDRHKEAVVALICTSPGKIHLSFNL